ncbi:MAG: type II toxin-antitoxin system VapC family toxin [Actinomycetales bacterium]|nr:type II toxin-antitoxin system VapC family toxin [Actinomycetales bacterium]
MIVLDNSVLVAVVVSPDQVSAPIRRRLRAERLVAPELIDIEFANALRGLVRGGKLEESQADRALGAIEIFPLRRVPHRPLLRRIWELRDNVTAYDAAYVALAEALDVPLLTGDHRLRTAAGVRCPVEVLG